MKTTLKTTALLLVILLVSIACTQKRELAMPSIELTTDFLIPHPVKVTATNSSFPLDQYTAITTSMEEGFDDVGLFLAEKIKATTSLDLQVNPASMKDIETVINIHLKSDFETDNLEAYELDIRENEIMLHAASAAGAFRGIQTIQIGRASCRERV